MQQYIVCKLILVFLLLIVPSSTCIADELKMRYGTIIYKQADQLSQLDNSISIESFSDLKKSTRSITDAVRYKLDSVVEKIELLLHVCPRDLEINVMLLTNITEVRNHYKSHYGIDRDYIAFYSPQKKTVFISVRDIDNYILAHELTHAIVDQYFETPPSAIIQEILAHFVATHMEF
jgi:hypothetical protein